MKDILNQINKMLIEGALLVEHTRTDEIIVLKLTYHSQHRWYVLSVNESVVRIIHLLVNSLHDDGMIAPDVFKAWVNRNVV